MKTQYERDFSKEYFLPLISYNFNPSAADQRQMVLAKNLNRSYHIPERNLLRLIMYTDTALSQASISEKEFFLSDIKAISKFEKNPGSIDKVIFAAGERTFEINNPYFIDKLYLFLKEISDCKATIEDITYGQITAECTTYFASKLLNKKRQSGAIIKKVATELYIELTDKEKITGSRPLYIIGYIFSLYGIGLKRGQSILTELQHKEQNEYKKSKGITTESYLSYLAGHMKSYINWRMVNSPR